MTKKDKEERPSGEGTGVTGDDPGKTVNRMQAYLLDPKYKTRLSTLFARFSKGKDKKKGGNKATLRILGN